MYDSQPVEVSFSDPVFGDTVLRYEGAVIERFALDATAQGARFHRSMVSIVVEGPSRKGYLTLRVGLRGKPGGFDAHIAAPQGPVLDPLLTALAADGVPVHRAP